MEEKNYRKSPWRFVFLGIAVLTGLWLAATRLALGILGSLSIGEAASIGIIGGADGPTAILVASTGTDWDSILVGAILIVSVLAYLRLRRCKPKQ